MSSQKKGDPIEKIQNFQRTVLSKKPKAQDMAHEVRMMNFKVHPVMGDISGLDFANIEFIDALWSLGKLDEFFRREYSRLKDRDRDVFYRLIEDMRDAFHYQLNKAHIAAVEFSTRSKRTFEVEIVKDTNWKIH